MKKSKTELIGAFFIVGILIIMMIYSIISTIYVVVPKLVDKFNISNQTINKIFNIENTGNTDINYKDLYPFINSNNSNNEKSKVNIIEKYNNLVKKIAEKIEKCTSEKLMFYEKFVEKSYIYNNLIRYNLVSNYDGNIRIELEDGYFSRLVFKNDSTECAKSLILFEKYLNNLNINLLYIQAPYKISDNQQLSSTIYKDYSNENMNNLLGYIDQKVDYIDLRENIKNNNLNNLSLFFKTDHHWLPQTGLWATNEISKYLNSKYNLGLKIDNINPEKYNIKTYENIYLGSDGRYVTLAKAFPDDFDLITPKFNTKLSVKIPDRNINKTDSYENTLVDWFQIKYGDYYKISQYHSYIYGDRPLIEIHNELVNNNKKILLVRDSFSEVIVPFLALENEDLSVIDLRYFDGSLKTYINQYKPDIVIVMYNGDIITDLNNGQPVNSVKMWTFE